MSKKFPLQPIYKDEHGVYRFRANEITRWLVDSHKATLNTIMSRHTSKASQEQFAMLIGHSVEGFYELSYVREKTRRRVEKALKEFQRKEAIAESFDSRTAEALFPSPASTASADAVSERLLCYASSKMPWFVLSDRASSGFEVWHVPKKKTEASEAATAVCGTYLPDVRVCSGQLPADALVCTKCAALSGAVRVPFRSDK
jgi:hypothetical protein